MNCPPFLVLVTPFFKVLLCPPGRAALLICQRPSFEVLVGAPRGYFCWCVDKYMPRNITFAGYAGSSSNAKERRLHSKSFNITHTFSISIQGHFESKLDPSHFVLLRLCPELLHGLRSQPAASGMESIYQQSIHQ